MIPIRWMRLAGIVLVAGAMQASADTWPSKPVRVIVPVATGSSTDIVPRVVLEQLSRQLGQPIIVENRTGAGGTIGTALVAKSSPDGYTVLAHGSAHTIAPSIYSKLSYDPAHDFSAVIALGSSPNVLVVAPAKNFRTVGELVAAAQARPGTLNFSSVGIGTATHLSAERFKASAGVQAMHVPFRGGAEALTEAVVGRVDFFFGPVGLILPHVRDGKLVALAVNGTRRSASLPEVPTTSEAGIANAEYPIWYGLFLPSKTPRDIIQRLHRETLDAMRAPKTQERLAALAVDPMVMTPDELDAHVHKEVALNSALVKALGIKIE